MANKDKNVQARSELEELFVESNSELLEAMAEIIVDNDELLEQVCAVTSEAINTNIQGVASVLHRNDVITSAQHEEIFLDLFAELDD